MNPQRPAGKPHGVGVGPGDPELITRKAERILHAVDRIYHPAAHTRDSFVRQIVAPLDLPEEKFRAVSLCMSRERGGDEAVYTQLADDIAAQLHQGKSAAWLTEGDPLFFSTFFHLYVEMRRRHPDIAIEIVPGVTSMQAAACAAGVPLATLDERIAVLPATYGLGELPALLDAFATVVLVKVHGKMDELIDLLAKRPGVRAVYAEKIGTPAARIVVDLPSLRGQELPYFALVILRKHA
jgi:precorrin-2/cobalt-factor-2 C20-methyltransferase